MRDADIARTAKGVDVGYRARTMTRQGKLTPWLGLRLPARFTFNLSARLMPFALRNW